jgi:glycosyltransferase involved in cell wall biosynthesis
MFYRLNSFLYENFNFYFKNQIVFDKYCDDVAEFIIANSKVKKYLIIPQGPLALNVSNLIFEKTKANYVTWIMDDHLLCYTKKGWKYKYKYEERFRLHLENAKQVFSISPSMKEFYASRFNIKSEVLFGGTDKYMDMQPILNLETYKIVYFGSLVEWQIDSLKMLIPLLEKYNLQLHIYSYNNTLPDFLKHANVHHKGLLKSNEILETVSRYHAVVLPFSFDLKYRNMVELNIPTKLSEALASGAIPIIIGPNYSAVSNYLAKADIGIHINNLTNGDEIELIKNDEYRLKMRTKTKRFFESNASSSIMQNHWLRAFHDHLK